MQEKHPYQESFQSMDYPSGINSKLANQMISISTVKIVKIQE